jgi:hypothetical protein
MMKPFLTALFLFICVPVFAEVPSVPVAQVEAPALGQPSNLTFSNFFSEGWNQEWTKRVTPGGAPDMALLHVQTNFLEREFRTDYYNQQNVASDDHGHVSFLDGLIAYGLNRRFMIEVVGNYQWKNSRKADSDISGAAAAVVGRLQLVDVPGSSLAYNFRVNTPNSGLGVNQTEFINAIAGWQDLTRFGLKRVGLYYSVQLDTYSGPAAVGSEHNDLLYDVSLAKTWTDPNTFLLGNFTTFAEVYATSYLDGSKHGQTVVNATPGIRLTLGHGNVLMGGVDLPVSTPLDFNATYRLTYIYNF